MITDFLSKFEDVSIPIYGVRLPTFHIEDEYKKKFNIDKSLNNSDFLKRLCEIGFERLHLDSFTNIKEYKDRLNYELSVMNELGYVDYILLVWDVINFCEDNEIPVGLGRGCLNADAPVFTYSGYKKLKDVREANYVLNSSGKIDSVVNTMSYNCYEKLLTFKTKCDTFSEVSMTKDHKLFGIINHFQNNLPDQKKFFQPTNLDWKEARSFGVGDYLARFIGRTEIEEDLHTIDLAPYAKKFDDEFVYETHEFKNHPLSIYNLNKKTKISRGCLARIKKQRPVLPKKLNQLSDYLEQSGHSLQDFYSFQPYLETKFNRYLKVDENFCYVLGSFIGRGKT